jgi:cytochrome c nitrite reductase small subunit
MKNQDNPPRSFRERFLNKKVILMVLALVLVLGAGTGAALVKASDNPAFYNVCHVMKPYYTSWHDSNLLAHQHAAAGVECHDCHESSIAIQASEGLKYITGNYKEPLEKRNFRQALCLQCHSETGTGTPRGTSFTTAKANTNFTESNPHDSHNGQQECNLCHSMHRQSDVMCAQCHSFDWFDQLDDSWKK